MNLATTGEWITASEAVAIIVTHRNNKNMGEALIILKSACGDGSIRCRDRYSDKGWVLVPVNQWPDVYLNVGDNTAQPEWWGVPDGAQISRDDLEAFLAARWPLFEADAPLPPIKTRGDEVDEAIRLALDACDGKVSSLKGFPDFVRKMAGKESTETSWSDSNIKKRIARLKRPK
jgi:hypothetical protein